MVRPLAPRLMAAGAFVLLAGSGANWWLRADPPATHVPPAPSRASATLPSVTAAKVDRASLALVKPVLEQYCVVCHNESLKTAGLDLSAVMDAPADANPEVWEKVARKLRTQEMPPPGVDRPSQTTYAKMNSLVETALDSLAAASPHPGRVAVHRLNRVEYVNAVRDLLGVQTDGAALLSADDT